MENVNIIELDNGFKKLVPNKGYRLFDILIKLSYSEVITKTPERFIVIKNLK